MKWGLNIKFIIVTIFLIIFMSLIFSIILVYQSRKALLYEFAQRGQSLVQNQLKLSGLVKPQISGR